VRNTAESVKIMHRGFLAMPYLIWSFPFHALGR
jgi:hypothetical protein